MSVHRRASVASTVAVALLASVLALLASPASAAPGVDRASRTPTVVGLDAIDVEDGTVELQLLSINDFHGRLESPANMPEPDLRPIGGAAQLAGLIDELREANPDTAFVSNGDNIGASTFISAVDDDNPTLDILNAMGLEASSVGNHEFDKGMADLEGRVLDRAEFPYLGANVYRDGERALDAFHIQELGGVDVGYVGVVTEETPSLVTPDGIEGLEFRNPVAEIEDVVDDLKDGDPANGEADVIVVLAHEGSGASTDDPADIAADPAFAEFLQLSADVDVIFSGHTHRSYAVQTDVPGGGTRPVVQAEEYGKKVGRVVLTVDTESMDVTGSEADLIDVVGYEPNAEIAQLVADAKAQADVLGLEPIGSITADIRRDPNRATESVGANFIADVQLAATSEPGRGGAQIALMNPGGVRADFEFAPDGVITYGEAFAVQSFSNDVFTKSYTGAEIKQVLEEQWQPAGATRPVLWLGVSKGFTYQYDPTRPEGDRIDADSMKLDGVSMDPAGTYRVTVNSFLASGGDNFTTLAGGTDVVTTGDNDLTMLVDHFRANSPVTADVEPRTFLVEAPNPAAPFDSWSDFVLQQYADLTGNAPNPFALMAWTIALDQEIRTPDQLILQLLNADVSSNESTAFRLYDGLLDRPPSAVNLRLWVTRLSAGWPMEQAAAAFLAASDSPLRDLTDAQFVDALYQRVQQATGSDSARATWTARLSQGSWTRAAVAAWFMTSAPARSASVLDLKAMELVRSMLDRLPTAAEWSVVRDGLRNGEATLQDAALAILGTDEYAARVS